MSVNLDTCFIVDDKELLSELSYRKPHLDNNLNYKFLQLLYTNLGSHNSIIAY